MSNIKQDKCQKNKKPTPKCIFFKIQKIVDKEKDEEKYLKEARAKKNDLLWRNKDKTHIQFIPRNHARTRQWSDILQVFRE